MGNFFSEIGKITGLSKITTKSFLGGAAGVVGGMVGGPVGAAAGVSAMNALTSAYKSGTAKAPSYAPAVLTTGGVAGTAMTGQVLSQAEGAIMDRIATLAQRYGPAIYALAKRVGPTVLLGWSAVQIIRALLGGGGSGGSYADRVARASDVARNAPPAVQRQVFYSMMGHKHRGISYTELRGFRRVSSLLRSVGMHPKGLHTRRAHR